MVLLTRLVELVIFAFLLVSALSLGAALVRLVRIQPGFLMEALLLSLGLGLAGMAYGVFLVGLAGWLYPVWGVVWAAVAAALGVFSARRLLRSIQRPAISYQPSAASAPARFGIVERILQIMLVLLVLLSFIGAFVPPTISEWDSLQYHLAVPKLYLKAHRIYYIDWLDHSNFPFTMEMLYTLSLLLANWAVAKLFHWLCFVGCLGVLLALPFAYMARDKGQGTRDKGQGTWDMGQGKRDMGQEARGTWHVARDTVAFASVGGAAAFAAMPLAVTEARSAYIDLGLTFYTLLTFYALLRWLSEGRGGWLALTGIFCGVCMGIKYTGVLVLILASAIVLWSLVRQPMRGGGRHFAFMILLALLIGSPWYVKNVINTGNPFYPFFYEIFGGRNWNQKYADQYREHQRSFGTERDLLNLVLMPWNVTMRSAFMPGEGGINYEVEDSGMKLATQPGFALLALLPTLLVGVPKPPPVRALLFASIAWLFVWFFTVQYLRYLLPCLALLCALAGYAYAHWCRRSPITALAAKLCLTLALLHSLVICLTGSLPVASDWYPPKPLAVGDSLLPLPLVAGGWISEETFLAKTLPVYRIAAHINQKLPPDARILTYGEPLGFYLERDYLWGDPGHHLLIDYDAIEKAQDSEKLNRLMKALERLGVTHLLVNRQHFDPWDEKAGWLQKLVREGIERRRFTILVDDGPEVLLEVAGRGED